MIEKLRNTLFKIQATAGDDFSGIGVIVHVTDAELPVFPLRLNAEINSEEDTNSFLARISSINSNYHDGFHLISTGWKVTKISQYFSPPIVVDKVVNRTRNFGGRYLAAQFGSALPGVELCGVASRGFGLAIFKDGHEVYFEKI